MKRILIIGGYGNFGSFISRRLAGEKNIRVIIAGRSLDKAQVLADDICGEAVQLDIHSGFGQALDKIKPDIVIHTSGPFQAQGYDVAKACIERSVHYIDLADGREFVAGIGSLHDEAKAKGSIVISGASSVPCLTSALLDDYQKKFSTIESVNYGISTAQRTARGLATTAAILGYTGTTFETVIDGEKSKVYGWQGLHSRHYKELGNRFLGYCNIPDLELFPARYPDIKDLRFYAGLEIPLIHLTLWILSWLVRLKLIRHLEKAAPAMLKLSHLFDWLGTSNSAFHMELKGKGLEGEKKHTLFEITARSGDGPYIPCMPAIILTKKIADGELVKTGAYPCLGFISKDEYLNALGKLDITWNEDEI